MWAECGLGTQGDVIAWIIRRSRVAGGAVAVSLIPLQDVGHVNRHRGREVQHFALITATHELERRAVRVADAVVGQWRRNLGERSFDHGFKEINVWIVGLARYAKFKVGGGSIARGRFGCVWVVRTCRVNQTVQSS